MPRPDEKKITEILSAQGVSLYVECFDTIDSTNSEARRYAVSGGALPALITADSQTAGRGRAGRSFYSPSGTGVYETIVYKTADLYESVSVTCAAALAVCRAIESVSRLDTGIKWVNDIYVGGGKVCGILAESFPCGGGTAVAVGIGINAATDYFPEDIRGRAASLRLPPDNGAREELAALSAANLIKLTKEPMLSYIDEYREKSIVTGKDIMYGAPDGDMYPARALKIDDAGGLVIRTAEGEIKTLFSGEVTVRLK